MSAPLDKANPFAAILAQAAAGRKNTGATSGYKVRIGQASARGGAQVVLADVSSSMLEAAGNRSRYEMLRDALAYAITPEAILIAFSSAPMVVTLAALPPPSGGTALHLALAEAAARKPVRTVVVTDGEPDSEDLALKAADDVPGIIDCIYCGPDNNTSAKRFLRRLARKGCGVYEQVNLKAGPALGPVIRRQLLLGGGGQ